MADVIFYEKPGCAGNARQKMLLAAAGHTVMARDVRRESWTASKLLAFFAGLPVGAWFNRSAPALKSGDIVPENLNEPQALALMLENPLLIRRPLLQVGEARRVGFNANDIDHWIGLGDNVSTENLEACAHGAETSCGRGSEPDSRGGRGARPWLGPDGDTSEPPDGHGCRCTA